MDETTKRLIAFLCGQTRQQVAKSLAEVLTKQVELTQVMNGDDALLAQHQLLHAVEGACAKFVGMVATRLQTCPHTAFAVPLILE